MTKSTKPDREVGATTDLVSVELLTSQLRRGREVGATTDLASVEL